jgi:hypothetical protein
VFTEPLRSNGHFSVSIIWLAGVVSHCTLLKAAGPA